MQFIHGRLESHREPFPGSENPRGDPNVPSSRVFKEKCGAPSIENVATDGAQLVFESHGLADAREFSVRLEAVKEFSEIPVCQ
jgi:hypothetical protein